MPSPFIYKGFLNNLQWPCLKSQIAIFFHETKTRDEKKNNFQCYLEYISNCKNKKIIQGIESPWKELQNETNLVVLAQFVWPQH